MSKFYDVEERRKKKKKKTVDEPNPYSRKCEF